MVKKEMIAMLLAGGQGSRLGVLTSKMAKPAVAFGGKYRIIDFPLSNCINSGVDTVGVLTQYQPLRLNSHIGIGIPWDLDRNIGGVTVLPPYERSSNSEWYTGTANAVYQNMEYMERYHPDYVLILSGDHIYKMDYELMLDFHKENNADVTAETKARDDAKTAWDNAAYVASVRKNELTAKKIEVSELKARIALLESKLPVPEPSPKPSDDVTTNSPGTTTPPEATKIPVESPAPESSASPSPAPTGSSGQNESVPVSSQPENSEAASQSGENGSVAMLSESGDIAQLEKELEELNRQLQAASEAEINAQRAYDEASLEETRRKEEYDRAEQRLEEKKNSGNTDYIISNLKQQQSVIDGQKKQAQIVLAEKQAAVTDREKTLSDKQKDLEELASRIGKVSGLEAAQEAVDKAQKLVDELTEKSIDATIKAPVAGTVTTLNVVAGESTSPSDPVAVLQPAGKGYSLSFSVTNEQAKRLSVGDVADLVNAWRYDDVTVTLASIKPDTKEPGQKKLLTFDVSGNVTAGQTLDLSVGQKSANYDLIVPNSAIREDNNGKFILIVESKPGPLNTRYIATRVDVEVLASDDTQSAISAALYGYEFVITTSTKPVEAGKQVRLADG